MRRTWLMQSTPALTAALSPGERESGIQPHHNRTRPARRTLNDCLPLPGGEGLGEGEFPKPETEIIREQRPCFQLLPSALRLLPSP